MNESRATRYQRRRRRAQAAGALSVGTLLALVALTPAAHLLADAARAAAAGLPPVPSFLLGLTTFVLAVVFLAELAALPAVLYRSALERTYAQGGGTVDGTLAGHLQAAGVALVAVWLVAVLVRLSVWAAGGWWWALAGAGMALLLAGLLRLGPVLLARLAAIRPLSRPGLGDALSGLSRRVGVPVGGIEEWAVSAGSAATALVTGVGRSRRVLLSSEVVRSWADDEIAVVVAHELAHHAYHDLWRAFALNVAILTTALGLAHLATVTGGLSLGLAGPADLASLPLVALVVGIVWAVAAPLRHAQSRLHERRADRFALRATGGAEAFGAAVRRLSQRRLAEERPSTLTRWLHYRHPSVAERLAVAEAWTPPTDE
jgi:STE24 endopeptidase